MYNICCDSELSTHDLTQRSTDTLKDDKFAGIFQLTTSRRGRRMQCSRMRLRLSFNSRPHAEVDIYIVGRLMLFSSFNSRPHAEVDVWCRISYWSQYPFNSRPHAEVDLQTGVDTLRQRFFQLTTSRRGRHQYFTYFMQNFDPISYIFHKNHFK